MSSRDDWQASPYGHEARERSIEEARERIREAEQDMKERRCRCETPVPDLGTYLGYKQCRLCRCLILN